MKICLEPIAYVKNTRSIIQDDNWAKVISEIELIPEIAAEALNGIEAFSHLEIIFYMDRVLDEKAVAQCRHPRKYTALPKVGTFAQRNKNRPNKLGLTKMELLEKKERSIVVRNLDAIDGTPILDIKPVMAEFQAKKPIHQPEWTREVMKNYWNKPD